VEELLLMEEENVNEELQDMYTSLSEVSFAHATLTRCTELDIV
jgi:hypothetical protein